MIINDLKSLDFLSLDDDVLNKLEQYMNITLEENKKFNLTRNDTNDEFIIKNILDSLLIIKNIDLNRSKILDIGSGAGLPGIPLAIYYKESKFVLLEPTSKRANFLAYVADKLVLKNVKVVCKRAEDYINENQREKYDFVVSRAVSKLNILLELSIPYLIVNGKLVAYKGLTYKEEILDSKNALKELNSTLIAINEDILDFTTENRFNLIIQKNKSTSNKYPRLYKEIKKRPL